MVRTGGSHPPNPGPIPGSATTARFDKCQNSLALSHELGRNGNLHP